MEAQLSKLTESLNQMNEIQRDNSDNSRKLFRLLDNLETSFLNMEIGGLEETGFGKTYEPVQKGLLEGIERGVQGMKQNLIDRAKDALYEFGIIGKFRNAQRKRAQDSAKAESEMKGDIFSSLRVALRSETVMENISETMDKMYKIAKQEQEANAIQRGFSLESSREEGRGGEGDDGKEDMLAHRKEKGGIFGKLGKIFSKYARLIEVAAIGIGIALLAFFNSDTFKKIKKVFIEDIWPATKTLFNDYLIPIAGFLWDKIVSTWDAIMNLFSGLSESFDLFSKGDWWGGITTFFGSIGQFVLDILDSTATLLWNTIATIFGFETTDSVGGSIKQFFSDLWLTLKFKVMWMWLGILTTLTETWTSITTTITDLWTNIKNKVTEVWDGILIKITETWDGIKTTITDLWTNIKNKVTETWTGIEDSIIAMFDKFVAWVQLLFTDPVEAIKVYIKGYLHLLNDFGGWIYNNAIKPVVDWIGGLFGKKEGETSKSIEDWVGDKLKKVTNFAEEIYKKYIEPVTKWVSDMFSDDDSKGAAKGFDIGSMFGGVDFEFPSIENIMARVGERINDVFQMIAQKIHPMEWIPKKLTGALAGLFADGGFAAAQMMGAKNISKFNVESGEMDVLKTEPSRPPGAALKGEAGAGAGGGSTNLTDASTKQTVNSTNTTKVSQPLPPHHWKSASDAGTRGRTGGGGYDMW